MKINKLLDEHFIKTLNIDTKRDYEIENVEAKRLITFSRIDLIAKYKYIEAFLNQYDTDFYKSLYKATIEAFSLGKYNEPGNKNKNSFDSFISTFNSLIKDIKENGFDANKSVIPIGMNGAIIDGAHRVSIGAYLNKKLPAVKIDATITYDLKFFKDILLDAKYLDYMCLEYAKLKNNIYVFCLWPRCSKEKKKMAMEYISNHSNIIYSKEILFNYNGLKNFMIEIYGKQDWVGTVKNKHNGILAKVDACYKENEKMICIVVEDDDANNILKIKKEIRSRVGIGNHAIHSTDTIHESIQMLSLLLNKITIDFLNFANIDEYSAFYEELENFDCLLKNNYISKEKIIIDSSSVLTVYGLRKNNDIDVLCSSDIQSTVEAFLEIHNSNLSVYEKKLDDMIFNPDNYFWFHGFKFLTLELVKKMKLKRMNENDINDIILIDKLNMKHRNNTRIHNVILIIRRKFIHIKRRFIIVLKENIKFILKKLGLYNTIKKVMGKE